MKKFLSIILTMCLIAALFPGFVLADMEVSDNDRALLVQADLPWGTTTNNIVLQMLVDEGVYSSYDVTTATAASQPEFDLSVYKIIVFANDQSQVTYDQYNDILKEKIENFAFNGGVVIFAACDQGWAGGTLNANLPGGIIKIADFDGNNIIADYTNPIVTGELSDGIPLTNADLYGTSCSHVSFIEESLPAGSRIIFRAMMSNRPTLVDYPIGKGNIIASGLTWEISYEWGYAFALKAYDDLLRYALSVANSYTVEYDGNGNDGGDVPNPAKTSFLTGETVTVEDNTGELSKTGYVFTGWNTKADGTGTFYEPGDTFEMAEDSVVLYACWELAKFTVTFTDWDDSVLDEQEIEYGNSALEPVQPSRTGYTFTGWNSDFENISSDTTVKAVYSINEYTLFFDTAGGNSIDQITQDFDTDITAPADPEREGFTFSGWDIQIPLKMPAEDLTITAKWNINQYKLTIKYTMEDDLAAPEDNISFIDYMADFSVVSPKVPGYRPDVKIVSGTMGAQDLVIDVTYIKTIVEYNNTDQNTNIKVDNLEEKINLPEFDDESVSRIEVSLQIDDQSSLINEMTDIVNDLTEKGYNLAKVFNIKLIKKVFGADESEETFIVENSDILGKLLVRIPIPEELIEKDNLVVAYISDDGEITILETTRVEIEGVEYLEFETDHFSNYAILETIFEEETPVDDEVETPAPGDSIPLFGTLLLLVISAACISLQGRVTLKLPRKNIN